MNAINAEDPKDINNRVYDTRTKDSTDFQLAIPAMQAQRAVSMSAQGNALGPASQRTKSPNGAALIKMKGF